MTLLQAAGLVANQDGAIRKHTSSAGGVLGLVDVALVRHDEYRYVKE